MTKFTIEEAISAWHPPYREIVFSSTEGKYFFTVSEDHKKLYSSPGYKDQDDCADRGASFLNALHEQKPLYQSRIPTDHPPARSVSKKGKSDFNG